jgi:hypothetical protein
MEEVVSSKVNRNNKRQSNPYYFLTKSQDPSPVARPYVRPPLRLPGPAGRPINLPRRITPVILRQQHINPR